MSEEKKTFKFSSKASKEAAEKQKQKNGYGPKQYKYKGAKARLMILPPVDEKEAVFFKVEKHQIWGAKDGKRTVVAEAASPSAFGEKDPLIQLGFKIKNKYKDSTKKGMKDIWKTWLPKRLYYVNVLDLENLDAGVQLYLMPGSVQKALLSELEDVDYDLQQICDFDSGKVLQVKGNGETGMEVRYEAKFLGLSPNALLEKLGTELDEDKIEEIVGQVYPLSKLQPKFDQDAFDKVEAALEKYAQKHGIDIEDVSDEDEDEDKDSSSDDDDDLEVADKRSKKGKMLDEDDDISDLDEDDDLPPPPKKKKVEEKTKEKKKQIDLDEDDDLPPPPKKKNKAPEIDEEEEFELEEEEDDLPPPPKKKALKRG